MVSPRSVRNFLILMAVNGLVSIGLGVLTDVAVLTIFADFVFAEGSLLLVAGGFVGIVSLSPSLMKVRNYFSERYGDPPATDQTPDQGKEATPKSPKVERTAVEFVIYGAILLALSFAISIVVLAGI